MSNNGEQMEMWTQRVLAAEGLGEPQLDTSRSDIIAPRPLNECRKVNIFQFCIGFYAFNPLGKEDAK